jgi:septum formation protein
MIELQSGNKTSVVSCMIFKSPTTYLFDISTTTYQFLPFEKEAIDNYINSGECMGKAGAIMVEGFCKPYIKNVEGYESTAMGLCVEKIIPFMK